MTRREQIIDAGIEFTLSINPVCLSGGALWEQARMLNRNAAFEAGAKFADEHPYWHLVSEELPPVDTSRGRSDEIWLAFKGENCSYYYDKGFYIKEGSVEGFKDDDYESFFKMPFAWTELPKFK